MDYSSSFDTIAGDNIILRKARENDSKSMLLHVWSDEDVYRWMLFAPTFSDEEALDRCKRSISFQKDRFAWFISLKDTDEAIGLCSMRQTENGHWEECGICIGKAFQGRGYGKEAASLMLDLAFYRLCANDFRYSYFYDNIRSKKIADYFGFVCDREEIVVRPWDGAEKRIVSCVLSKEKYFAMNQ
jgi:RimJ/RimL family protein N-acetyltransferase